LRNLGDRQFEDVSARRPRALGDEPGPTLSRSQERFASTTSIAAAEARRASSASRFRIVLSSTKPAGHWKLHQRLVDRETGSER